MTFCAQTCFTFVHVADVLRHDGCVSWSTGDIHHTTCRISNKQQCRWALWAMPYPPGDKLLPPSNVEGPQDKQPLTELSSMFSELLSPNG